ncbi:MAG TPA: hypothetical protein VIM07_15145 [Chitinophagaceae bacterium]
MNQVKDKSRIYTNIAAAAAFIQMSVPQWHLPDVPTQVTSAVLLSIVSIFTILKQRTSVEINDKNAVKFTWLLIAIAGLGGINEIMGIVHFNDQLQNILRSVVAAAIGLLNLASKNLFPTEAGKVIQTIKADIKQGNAVIEPLNK